MNFKNITSRVIAAAFMLAGSALTANAAQEWTYGKHTNDFTFSGGKGTQAEPFLISNAQDLADLAYLVTEKNNDVTGWYFKQTDDITLNDIKYDSNGNLTNKASLKDWIPIGEYGYVWDDDFQGIYDGGGHTVSGVYFNQNTLGRRYIGLFGSCENAIVKNLTVKDVCITLPTDDNINNDLVSIGAVVGRATSSTFTNVKVDGNYVDYKTMDRDIACGGLVGRVDGNAHFTDCSFTGNIKVYTRYTTCVGGLIGYVQEGELYMKRCFTGKGTIYVTPETVVYDGDENYVGGLIGCYKKFPDGDYIKKYGIEECTNNMDIVVGNNSKNKWKNLYAYAISYKVPSIINCANFGNITVGSNVWNSRIGFTNNFNKAMYSMSYGKYAFEEGTTLDRDVYIDILGKYSDNSETIFDESTLNSFIKNGSIAGGSGVFVCPKECLPDNVSTEWKTKYCSAKNTQVSTEFLKKNGESLATRVNQLYGKSLWSVARMNMSGISLNITGCPITHSAENFESFMGEGTYENPYLITSETDLRALQSMMAENSSKWADKYYKLTTDIDLAGKTYMEAIGTEDAPFTGLFDGNGHIISNLTERGPALFGYLGGIVKNLGIVNIDFVGSDNTECAGIAYQTGKNNDATITDCYVGGKVSMTVSQDIKTNLKLSGLVSKLSDEEYKTTIKNCYFKGVMSIDGSSQSLWMYYGIVGDNYKFSRTLTCSDCYASFTARIVNPVKHDVTGLMPSGYVANVNNCFYVCDRNNESLGDKIASDAELASHFSGKDGWLSGAWRPVLKSVRHYRTYSVGLMPYYVDAIPMGGNDNEIYNLSLSDKENSSYADDPMLWALPNVAVYNPADQTEYILNCNLVAGSKFLFNKEKDSKMVKGEMHYPLTVSQNGYSMLCLPGIVRKECMPEGSRLFICGEVNKKDGKLQSNIVECDTVPAGVPFIVKVPTETTDADGTTISLVGKTFDVVMRGEIVSEPQTTLPTGATTGLHGTFNGNDYAYSCVDINEDNGTLKVKGNTKAENTTPLTGYFRSKEDIYLIDYILLDETANDIQDIITDNKGKTVNIKLKRALQPQKWNTICLPFAMSDDEIQNTFGDGTLVEQLTGVVNTDGVCTLTFSKTTEGIKAGKAYLIKPASDSPATVLSFRSKEMASSDKEETETFNVTGASGTLCFQGIYARTALNSDGTTGGLYFTQNNYIYKVVSGSNIIMNGFRCFISTSEPNVLSAARMIHNDGSTTDLRFVEVGSTADGQRVYNLQGMQADEQTGRGVYIKKGRKFVRK